MITLYFTPETAQLDARLHDDARHGALGPGMGRTVVRVAVPSAGRTSGQADSRAADGYD